MAAGDIALWSDVSTVLFRPVVRLVQTASQNFTSNTEAPVTFTTEEIDTHGFHDTAVNTERITPNVPGYYQLNCTFFMPARADYTSLVVRAAKNGGPLAPRASVGPNTTSTSRSVYTTAIATANGSTDYFSMLGTQINAAAAVQASSPGASFSSAFEVVYLRPL